MTLKSMKAGKSMQQYIEMGKESWYALAHGADAIFCDFGFSIFTHRHILTRASSYFNELQQKGKQFAVDVGPRSHWHHVKMTFWKDGLELRSRNKEGRQSRVARVVSYAWFPKVTNPRFKAEDALDSEPATVRARGITFLRMSVRAILVTEI